ncbi:MAG: hypothetical protein EOP49_46720, partial [Sphingobacteriales bacterium]
MYNPGATYRIQFHKDFTFDDLEKIIPYLHQLGIRTIYASPVFAAMPGSTHGYDGIDPNQINPEIGTPEQLRRISTQPKSLGMGWIQDFVPNHMAYAPDNPWICDFMEQGKMSAYDQFFVTRGLFGDEPPQIEWTYINIFWRSICQAGLATFLCLLIGFPTAWFIATRPEASRPIWLFLITIPYW